MSSASWKSQTSLSQLAPSALSKAIGGLQTVLSDATNIIRTIEGVVQVAEKFLTSPGDVVVAFLQNYSSALFQVIADTLSLGGGFIFIHPYNRINRRIVNILPSPAPTTTNRDQIVYPLNLPVMTPQEAFNEFYASFNNTEDPFRPQWTTNTKVTGFGLLFTAPDPVGLVAIMNAFQQLVDFKEITDLSKGYSTDVQSWYDNTIGQVGSDFSNFLDFDITGLNIKTVTTTAPDGTQSTQVTQVFDSSLPSLHWYGLSLSNFVFLKNLEKLAKDLVNSLVKIIQSTDNFITELANALIRRLDSLLNLVTTVIKVAEGFLVSLNSTGVYYFSIPSGVGGVQYIQNAIQSSLTNPTSQDAQRVKAILNSTKFSALFFAGAGYGVDLSAWDALFKNAFDETNFVFDQLFNAQFSVLPTFNSTVFNFGQTITLSVVSQDATDANPLWFTYEIKDNKGGTVYSFLNKGTPNDARVNQAFFSITFAPPQGYSSPIGTLPYTITVNVFNQGANNKTFTTTFYLTDNLSGINTRVDPQTPLAITTGECGGTMAILNANAPAGGASVETTLVSPNSTANLGTTVGPADNNLVMTYTSSCSDETSITLPVENNTGFTIGNVGALPLPPSFRFLSFPGKICLNFSGAFKYSIHGQNNFTTITLPACFTVAQNTCYDYYVYTPDTGWQGLFTFCIVQQATAGTQIC